MASSRGSGDAVVGQASSGYTETGVGASRAEVLAVAVELEFLVEA